MGIPAHDLCRDERCRFDSDSCEQAAIQGWPEVKGKLIGWKPMLLVVWIRPGWKKK